MPAFVYATNEFSFVYSATSTTVENRWASTVQDMTHADVSSILCPGGTANLEVWVNNSKPYNQYAQERYYANLQPGTVDLNANHNQINPSFTANWQSIMNTPILQVSPSAFFISSSFRFIRLQSSSSLTGAATATWLAGNILGYLWSSNMEYGM